MTKIMKKDNAVIKASEGLARELALQGWVEDGADEVVSDEVATQPNPYDEDDMKKMDVLVDVEKAKIAALDEANAELKEGLADEGLDLSVLTKDQLKAKLDEAGTEYSSSATKDELIALLEKK
jgi:hypothetical protein